MLERSKTVYIDNTDMNLYKICDNIFIGSGAAAKNINKLKEQNITCIINAASLTESCCFEDKINYLSLPLYDSHSQNIMKEFEVTNKFIDTAIMNGGSIFVHCHSGISRAPTICAAYLIMRKKIGSEEALNLIKQIKSDINPNKNFKNQLKLYGEQINSSY